MMSNREIMEYDVLIVGAGPAGLACAIKLKQISPDIRVCIIEKGSAVGSHILSGAVIETIALDKLIPDWKQKGAPLNVAVNKDCFLFLTEKHSFSIPHFLLPPELRNQGNYIVSLANVCRWLATQAQELGVDIFPGFAAKEIAYDDSGKVIGVIIGDSGIAKDGSHKPEYVEGIEIHAKLTLLGEGCSGSLSEKIIEKFSLRDGKDPQSYGLGIKEIWEIDPSKHQQGLVQHTAGWPLDAKTFGGSFIYHLDNHRISIGFVCGLDYQNPYFDPYEEMQRFKTHPMIKSLLEGGKRIAFGARSLNEGGYQSIPKLVFPGGALIGCSAGFLNVAKIKGSHNAMLSGMFAAEAVVKAISENQTDLHSYQTAMENSGVFKELYRSRNFRCYFKKFGLWIGTLLAGMDSLLFHGKVPYTLHHKMSDRQCLKKKSEVKPIYYNKPDGKITFNRMDSVYLTNIKHDENQPIHLHVKDMEKEINFTYAEYDSPEQRYCPAGVYELLPAENKRVKLHINSANCVHCKACDIKDPARNIEWRPPEGGSGPNYSEM